MLLACRTGWQMPQPAGAVICCSARFYTAGPGCKLPGRCAEHAKALYRSPLTEAHTSGCKALPGTFVAVRYKQVITREPTKR